MKKSRQKKRHLIHYLDRYLECQVLEVYQLLLPDLVIIWDNSNIFSLYTLMDNLADSTYEKT